MSGSPWCLTLSLPNPTNAVGGLFILNLPGRPVGSAPQIPPTQLVGFGETGRRCFGPCRLSMNNPPTALVGFREPFAVGAGAQVEQPKFDEAETALCRLRSVLELINSAGRFNEPASASILRSAEPHSSEAVSSTNCLRLQSA